MTRFFRWLRSNAEGALVAAAQDEMLERYRGSRPARPAASGATRFWRSVFVPTYRALPWGLKRRIMRAMPGSHRGWSRTRNRRPR